MSPPRTTRRACATSNGCSSAVTTRAETREFLRALDAPIRGQVGTRFRLIDHPAKFPIDCCVPRGIRRRKRGSKSRAASLDTRWGRRLAPEGEPRRPQGDAEVSEPDLRPIYEDFPHWLGGMTQEEAGLVVTLVAVA